jgi:DNA-binding transcriptional ArsR family regulator
VTREWDPDDVFDVLASETARTILALTSERPLSADELVERCPGSAPTVSRRLNVLVEYDLLVEETAVDPDGHHYRTFETDVESICFDVGSESLDPRVGRERDLLDRVEELWSDLEGVGE